MDINKILNNYPTDKEIDVICIKNGTGLKFGKKYKASLINTAFLPLHWEVNNTMYVLEYLIPVEEWRDKQINKIIS